MRRRHLLCSALPALQPLAAQAQAEPLGALLRERLRHEGMGLAVARIRPGQAPELAAEGRSGRGTEGLDPGRHRFEIGSITKTFIGLLLADAVLRREVGLDDAVEDLLPDGLRLRDKAGLPLRWVDLATHRSGLPRLPEAFAPGNAQDPYADFGEDALRAALQAFQPQRGREQAFEYSNFGFGLLAWLLARRAARPLEGLLRERVLAPLGLEGLRLRTQPRRDLDAAQGHNALGQPVPPWHFSEATAGAGALQATAAQMAAYAMALLGRSEHALGEAVALALRPHSALGPQAGVQMGLAWMLVERGGRRLATHDGGTFGFSSSLWLDRTRGQAGLALANAFVPVTDLARHLMDETEPLRDVAAEQRERQALTQQAAQVLEAAQLRPLAGVYALNPRFRLSLRVDGARLFAQASGQGEFELFAKAPRQFFARVTPLELQFDEGDPAPALTLRQAGQTLRFVRE